MSDVTSEGSTLLGANNSFTGSNTFTQTITGSINGNAATATSATTAITALTATTAVSASALAGTTGQCTTPTFAQGITLTGSANCLQPASTMLSDSRSRVRQTPILFNSGGNGAWNNAFVGVGVINSTESAVQQIVPIAGHMVAMRCFSQVAPTSATVFTLRQNGNSTAAACTIAAGSTKGSATVTSLAFSAGDLLDILVTGLTGKIEAVSIAVATTP